MTKLRKLTESRLDLLAYTILTGMGSDKASLFSHVEAEHKEPKRPYHLPDYPLKPLPSPKKPKAPIKPSPKTPRHREPYQPPL